MTHSHAPEQGAPATTRDDQRADDDAAVPPGNAGPDCFWLPRGTPLPTPRIAEVHSLDQQAKPLRAS